MRQITEAASNMLTQQLSTIFKKGVRKHAINIVSPTLCEKAISRLDLSAYKNPILIDMAPGICTWSAALHDALQPRAHILLEPVKAYKPWIEEFQATRRNTYWLPEHGDRWGLYLNMFGQSQRPSRNWPADYPNIMPRIVPPEEGINTDIIFTGNISESDTMNNRLMAQLIETIPRERWLMTFGRVRFLMWITDETRTRYLPRTVAGRFRATVMAETVCDVKEVVSSNTVSMGKGYPKPAEVFTTDEHGKIVLKDEHALEPEEEGRSKRGRPKVQRKKPPTPAEDTDTPPPPETTEPPPPETTEPPSRTRRTRQPRPPTLAIILNRVKTSATFPKTNPLTAITATLSELQSKYPTVAPSVPPPTPTTPIPDLRVLARSLAVHCEVTSTESAALSVILQKLKELERTSKDGLARIEARLAEFFADPANEGAWIEGTDHPAWFYKDNIPDLAISILRKRKEAVWGAAETDTKEDPFLKVHKTLRAMKFDESLMERFERDEEVAPPSMPLSEDEDKETSRKRQKVIDGWNKNWGEARGLPEAQDDIREDEIYSYKHKLLEFYRRDYESITAQSSDFYPETPLALLDFTPKLLHPYLRNPDLSQRDKTFETFKWLLRTVFLLRAHSVSSALATLAPGGEHILDYLAPGVHIDPDRRLRTLTADELVEITRAWDMWPFSSELAHLDEHMVMDGEGSDMPHKKTLGTLNFRGKAG